MCGLFPASAFLTATIKNRWFINRQSRTPMILGIQGIAKAVAFRKAQRQEQAARWVNANAKERLVLRHDGQSAINRQMR
jgi:hypothetical protein